MQNNTFKQLLLILQSDWLICWCQWESRQQYLRQCVTQCHLQLALWKQHFLWCWHWGKKRISWVWSVLLLMIDVITVVKICSGLTRVNLVSPPQFLTTAASWVHKFLTTAMTCVVANKCTDTLNHIWFVNYTMNAAIKTQLLDDKFILNEDCLFMWQTNLVHVS